MKPPVRRYLDRQRPRFCGKPESHPYEPQLAAEGIKHRTPKVRSPRTNGYVKRMTGIAHSTPGRSSNGRLNRP